MVTGRDLDRERILEPLRTALEPHPHVVAMWLEGADALRTVDAYSDIDLWLSVADGEEDAVLDLVRTVLQKVAPLELEHETPHPHPLLRQVFFHLEGTSPFLLLDLCVQARSRSGTFREGVDAVEVLFDKGNVIRFQARDEAEEALQERAEALIKAFPVRQVWVGKNIRRGLFLEALGAYHVYSLEPLTDLLRLVHTPRKSDFGLKDVYSDLPQDVVEELEHFYQVGSLEALAERHREVCVRFDSLSKILHSLYISE